MPDNYPPGVDNSHPHFHQDGCVDHCPNCEAPVNDEVWCGYCEAVLDEDEARAIEAAQKPAESASEPSKPNYRRFK